MSVEVGGREPEHSKTGLKHTGKVRRLRGPVIELVKWPLGERLLRSSPVIPWNGSAGLTSSGAKLTLSPGNRGYKLVILRQRLP